jgi:hypothetical protein
MGVARSATAGFAGPTLLVIAVLLASTLLVLALRPKAA